MSCGVREFTLTFVTFLAKRITCAQLHYFHKTQNAVLILSRDSQERIAQESLLRQIILFRLLSLSRSLALLSRSLALFCLYLALSLAQTVPLSLSLSLSLCLSISSSRFLSFSHTITHSLDPTDLSLSFIRLPMRALQKNQP